MTGSEAEPSAAAEPEPIPATHPAATPAKGRHPVVGGLVLGIATGLVVAIVDATVALVGPFGGSRPLHALAILALLVSLAGAAGALVGALFGLTQKFGKGDGFLIDTARSSLLALPLVAFYVWVPTGWIREHWSRLKGNQRTLSIVALLVIALGVFVGARVLYALYRRRVAGRFGTVWMAASLAFCVVSAAICYRSDAVLYQGDYEDFHYGLSVTFLCASALAVAIGAALLPDRFALRPERRGLVVTSAVLLLSFGVALFAPTRAFLKSNSLVFSKLVGTGRGLSDFDGDGDAGLLGGSDCAQFDARVWPGGLEVPENGLDDDCSGKDARWPPGPVAVRWRPEAKKLNILLISIDALRADHLGAYGYTRRTSPVIDRLASRSLQFMEAYSQAPKTVDSVPSIMTGAYPSNVPRDYGETEVKRKAGGTYHLAEDARPLAMLLRDVGYATAAGSGFRLLQVERGFETFDVGPPTATALQFLEHTNQPFFLWLHYPDPHIPYARHKNHDFGPSAIDRYDGEIAYVDEQVGKLLDAIDRLEIAENTAIIITADHGEEFLEHGGISHTRKLYRELLHVPLIVHVPGVNARRVRGPVELVDIVPTVAELTGIRLPAGTLDGESLLGERKKDQLAYAEDLREKSVLIAKRALFDGRYRLIDDRSNDRLELYDDKRDPREQRDIALRRADIAARLRELLAVHSLRRHTASMKALAESQDPALWASLLPTFRRPEVLDVALDRFPKERSAERDAVLQKLLSRRGLDEKVAAKARALLVP